MQMRTKNANGNTDPIFFDGFLGGLEEAEEGKSPVFPLRCLAFLGRREDVCCYLERPRSGECDIKQPGSTCVVADLNGWGSLLHFDYGWQ